MAIRTSSALKCRKSLPARGKQFLSASPKQTIAVAKTFAKTLKPGTVLALVGDLGSGKTTFIKGIALGLGFKNEDEVKSPTFVLMHLYDAKMPVYHFDLYRLESLKDFRSIGFEEFLNDSSAIICVEWAQKAKTLLPPTAIRIYFEHAGPNERRIRIERSSR